MLKNLNHWMTVASATLALCFFLPAFASAQECPSGLAHAHTNRTVSACSGSAVECVETCVCNRGYHPRDSGAPSASNPCVEDAPIYGSGHDPLCGFGAVRDEDGDCRCPAELAPRTSLHMEMLTVPIARDLASRGTIEALTPLIREQRLERMERRDELIAVFVCHDPMASGMASGSVNSVLVDAIDQRTRILCDSAEGASDEQVLADCRATRELIDSIRNLRPGSVTIHYGDRDYTVQEFVDELLVPKFGEIEQRLSALEGRVGELEDTSVDHERRIDNLEAAWHTFLDVTHIRLGGFGRLGFLASGPATGAGGAAGELLFRFGDAPVGFYGRIEFGGQETGYDVGGSLYLSGGAGLAFFTGGRRDTTIGIGLLAEDLLEPFADDPLGVMGSEVGVALGAEASASIPLPGDLYWIRIRAGLAVAYGERSHMSNGVFTTTSGVYVAPSLGLEFQPDFRDPTPPADPDDEE